MNHFVDVNKKVMAVMIALALCAGCATDQIRKNSYKLLGSYTVAVESAADIAENPATPLAVVDGIKEAKDLASPVVRSLHDNARAYADLQDQIQGIKDSGGEPSILLLEQSQATMVALQAQMAATAPRIADLLAAIHRSF